MINSWTLHAVDDQQIFFALNHLHAIGWTTGQLIWARTDVPKIHRNLYHPYETSIPINPPATTELATMYEGQGDILCSPDLPMQTTDLLLITDG